LGTGIAITTETAILIKLTGRGAAIPIQSIAIITLFRAFNYTIATVLTIRVKVTDNGKPVAVQDERDELPKTSHRPNALIVPRTVNIVTMHDL
jgi:hypothetical protein